MAITPPVRVGLVGVGRAGWGMHRTELAAHGGYRITAVCDVHRERAEKLAALSEAKVYTDYRHLVEDPDIDVVIVATRSGTHAEINIAALRAGKHVVAEKPFATSVAQADEQIAVAAQSPGKLLVRQNRRWDPAYLHIREILESGRLGEIFMVRLCRHQFQCRADWQTLKAFKGGLLNNWGPHIIDHGLLLLESPVVEIFSDLRNVAAAGDAEDHFKIVLKGANGRVIDIEVTGGMAIGLPVWQIFGSQGALSTDEKTIHLRWFDRSQMPPLAAEPGDPPMEGNFGSPYQIPWQVEEFPVAPRDQRRFYDIVWETLVEDKPYPVKLEEARQVVWVTEQARRGTGY